MDANSPEAVALAAELAEDLRYPARTAVPHLRAEGEEQERAKMLLDELKEFSLIPLAGAGSLPDPAAEVWAIRVLCEEFVALCHRTAVALKPLLANRQPFDRRASEGLQAAGAALRVCDLTFLVLQRMMHGGVSSSAFLGVPAAARDEQIDALENSTRFQEFLERQL